MVGYRLGYQGCIQRVYCVQNCPICYSIYVSSLLDQFSPNFLQNSIIILRTATSYFQFVFIPVILFHLRTGYLVGCRILVSEILFAIICITSFLSTKSVARMNDINQSSDQNIVLPKQLHYIICLTNQLQKLVYFEIINAKILKYVNNMLSKKANQMLYFRKPCFLIKKLYILWLKQVNLEFSIMYILNMLSSITTVIKTGHVITLHYYEL